MELFFNDTTSLQSSESKPEINSTYVAITGLVVFGFPVVSMTIFCLLRMQLDKRKRYGNFYVDDKIDGGAQCPMIVNMEGEHMETSTSSVIDRNSNASRFFRIILNFIRTDRSTSTLEEVFKDSSLKLQV